MATTSIGQNLLDSAAASGLDFADFAKASGGYQTSRQHEMKQMRRLRKLFTGDCEDASASTGLARRLRQLRLIDLSSNSRSGVLTTILPGTSLSICDTSMAHYPWIVPLPKKREFFLQCVSQLQGFILQFVRDAEACRSWTARLLDFTVGMTELWDVHSRDTGALSTFRWVYFMAFFMLQEQGIFPRHFEQLHVMWLLLSGGVKSSLTHSSFQLTGLGALSARSSGQAGSAAPAPSPAPAPTAPTAPLLADLQARLKQAQSSASSLNTRLHAQRILCKSKGADDAAIAKAESDALAKAREAKAKKAARSRGRRRGGRQ